MSILKYYRISNRISQEEMARKLNCSLPAYRNYENGKRVMPHNVLINFLKLRSLDQDLALAKVLEEIYDK